jgi:prepilin-type N-terminal cleavage/methylation domain-containing protein
MDDRGFSLIEIIIVIAIIGLIAGATIVWIKPQELIANGRNSKRVTDITAINDALGQWKAREGVQVEDQYSTLGLIGPGITALTPTDGSITGEGVSVSVLTAHLTQPGYLQKIPLDPDEVTEYRVGVNDVTDPQYILICTDSIELTDNYHENAYPNGIFCRST